MLKAQERAFLSGLSTNLKDLVFIGKEGLTDNVIKQIDDNLYAHELIKVKVQKSQSDDLVGLSQQIAEASKCEVVCIRGSKIILYKVTEKPKFKHLLG